MSGDYILRETVTEAKIPPSHVIVVPSVLDPRVITEKETPIESHLRLLEGVDPSLGHS